MKYNKTPLVFLIGLCLFFLASCAKNSNNTNVTDITDAAIKTTDYISFVVLYF